ncbi:MAG: hypothetical protein KGZ83_09500 [Sulfuricella sp.]|nr:hypothetical protein [Sulfuricella sp.]
MSQASRLHDDAVVELLQEGPAFAGETFPRRLKKPTSPEVARPCRLPHAISRKRKA